MMKLNIFCNLLNSILNDGLPLFHNWIQFLPMPKLEKLGGKSNMVTYRPAKYEDDEIRKTLIISELLHA